MEKGGYGGPDTPAGRLQRACRQAGGQKAAFMFAVYQIYYDSKRFFAYPEVPSPRVNGHCRRTRSDWFPASAASAVFLNTAVQKTLAWNPIDAILLYYELSIFFKGVLSKFSVGSRFFSIPLTLHGKIWPCHSIRLIGIHRMLNLRHFFVGKRCITGNLLSIFLKCYEIKWQSFIAAEPKISIMNMTEPPKKEARHHNVSGFFRIFQLSARPRAA